MHRHRPASFRLLPASIVLLIAAWAVCPLSSAPRFDEPIFVDALLSLFVLVAVLRLPQRRVAQSAPDGGDPGFRHLAAISPDFILRSDREGHILYLNAKLEFFLCLPAAAVIGKRVHEVWPDIEDARCQAVDGGRETLLEIRSATADGGFAFHQIYIAPEWDADDAMVGTVAFGHDVTASKVAEETARQENANLSERLQAVLSREITERLHFQTALAKHEAEACRHAEFERLLLNELRHAGTSLLVVENGKVVYDNGFILSQKNRTPASDLTALIHPDDRLRILDIYRPRRAGEPAANRHEIGLLDEDGRRREYEFFVTTIPSTDSVRTLTLARDISERKAAETNLRIAAGVFETAREGIVVTDPAGVILDLNRAFTHITGYRREEMIGNRTSLLKSGRHDREFYSAIWKALHQNGTWAGEVINRRANGELFTEQLSISAVYDERGETLRYVGVFSDCSQFRRQEQQLDFIVRHDTLTGLPNRILLTDRMRQAVDQACRTGGMFAVLFIDLDGFKPINDRYGHDVGDRTLVEMAARMTQVLRAGDTVARTGGDEFVLLLTDLAGTADCERTARELLEAIALPVVAIDTPITLSASLGIAIHPDDSDDPDSLLRYADQAMYAAKRLGRNQFVFYGEDLQHEARLDGGMVHDLRLALEQGEIEVHYQPIVDLATGKVLKAEALARWTHPQRGPISPAEFIPVAEEAGLIHAIGQQVFRIAVRVAQEWNRVCPERRRRICINRSPREFLAADSVAAWRSELHSQQATGEMVELEITEGLLLDDRPAVLFQLEQLQAMGMTIALDDFGTGYSALSYLSKFDIDCIKIDRAFIRDIVEDDGDRAIVESMIAMARRLGIGVIAEGVETAEQAALLAAAHCDSVQGFFFARPMPEAEFLAFVREAEHTSLNVPATATPSC